MARPLRLVLIALCTLCLWLSTSSARAEGELCAEDTVSEVPTATSATATKEQLLACLQAAVDSSPSTEADSMRLFGGLCDELGASRVAPPPLLIVPESSLDNAEQDTSFTDRSEPTALTRAPRAIAPNDSSSIHAVLQPSPCVIGLPSETSNVRPQCIGCRRPGFQSSLDRPPRTT